MRHLQALFRCSRVTTGFASSLLKDPAAIVALSQPLSLSTLLEQLNQTAFVHAQTQAFLLPKPQLLPRPTAWHSSTGLPSVAVVAQSLAAPVQARTQGATNPQCLSSRGYAKKRRPGPASRPLPQQQQEQQQQQQQQGSPLQSSDDEVQFTEANATQTSEPGTAVQAAETTASHNDIVRVVGHPALIISRAIEWGTVIFGFEQANRYEVRDQDGNIVALLAEDLGGFGKSVGRQLLRTRRPFTATVFSPDGTQIIFRVRRPFYLINSHMNIEDGAGNVIGEVHQRWHLWQRNYAIYIDRKQFAAINGNFLAWEFTLTDERGGVLALIDRNFQGFGKELFTDAGKYVVHFGNKPQEAAEQVANTVEAAHPDRPRPQITPLARMRTDVAVIPTQTGNQLAVVRSLSLSERMIALAAAISIDYNYFSQHSHGSGWFPMFMPLPIPPYPAGGGGDGDVAGGTGAEGGEGEAPAGDAGAAGDAGGEGLERDLGSDPYGGQSGLPDNDLGGDDWGGADPGEGIGDGGGEEGGSGFGDLLGDFFGSN
ncbi:hypothetical protein WJX74_010281 [Apatococcus lobatus]|uniref:Phospholipid scramblase n=1 Tax=Apatococcus lobatus TaxID=904363 RepID=A0AAW1QXT0_9CHLO